MQKVVLVTALAAVSAGCAMFGGKPGGNWKPLEPAEYYPLAVGNSWTYSANMLGDHSESTVTIVKQDFGWFVDDHKSRFKVDAYGLRDEKRYLIRAPLEVGKAWTSVVSVQSVEHAKIVDTDESVTVLAGVFDHCLTVETSNRQDDTKTLIMRMTFAPHVGIVRIQTTLDAEGKLTPQTSVELTAYRVKPPAAPARPEAAK
ncbi:MAG TPA: hypothetical protein VIG99_20120 [Myxococcaceae bacterium]